MSSCNYETLLSAHRLKIDIINSEAEPLLDGREFFLPISVPLPVAESKPLCFLKLVSYLYVLLNESGKINIKFIFEKFSVYSLNNKDDATKIVHVTNKLRTFFYHNLYSSSARDTSIRSDCYDWFKSVCEYVLPINEKQWEDCSIAILADINNVLEMVHDCIKQIKDDEHCKTICTDWNFKIDRYHPPHEFDSLIPIVASDIGKDFIDSEKFRKKNYDSWINQLLKLTPGYDFGEEARKIIEFSLLSDEILILPVSGGDLISELGIEPGPKIGEMLKVAQTIYKKNPCKKEELLELLKKAVQNSTDNLGGGE